MASLYIYMNGYEVGEYIHHASGLNELIYSDLWIVRSEVAMPLSLSLPLTEKKHKGEKVYNYFED